jgi:hypothetical protein
MNNKTNFINSVNKLKNFGSFRKYISLPGFSKMSLFYSYNASVETTLTKYLSALMMTVLLCQNLKKIWIRDFS